MPTTVSRPEIGFVTPTISNPPSFPFYRHAQPHDVRRSIPVRVKRDVVEGLAYSGDDLMGKSIGRRTVAAHAGDSELADGPSSTDDNVAIGNLAWRFNANIFPEKHGKGGQHE